MLFIYYNVVVVMVAITRSLGEAVITPPFHGGVTGSIPVGITNTITTESTERCFLFFFAYHQSFGWSYRIQSGC